MENDNKIYDLLERIYMEMQDMKANMATKEDIKLLKDDIKLLGVELQEEIQLVYEELKELRNDLNSMELLTTRNAYEIAKLKAVK